MYSPFFGHASCKYLLPGAEEQVYGVLSDGDLGLFDPIGEF